MPRSSAPGTKPRRRRKPRKPVAYAVCDGGSYRSVYTPYWKPGTEIISGPYGYWSAYRHDPDGTIKSLHVNLSNCDTFAQVERKVRRWHPELTVRNAHTHKGDSYVD